MLKAQCIVEKKYSAKNVRAYVMADIDENNPAFIHMIKLISDYRRKPYHPSKQDRINKLFISDTDIAIEIMIAILPIKEVSPIQAVCSLIGSKLGYLELLDSIKTAAELLAITEPSGIFIIYHSSDYENDTSTLAIRANYAVEDNTAAFIENTKYLPPMVCKPVKWSDNSSGGYLGGTNSILLGHLNHHNEPQALNVINILQDIEWSLNSMVDYVEYPSKKFKNKDSKIQFEFMRNSSTDVYDELIELGNKFHFIWQFDKRGRMYCKGYHVSVQSTSYKKSIIEFTKKELIQ